MKYIDADKLIAEIERRRDSALTRQKNLEKIGQETVLNEMIAFELNRLISFVVSLQQEQPMDIPSAGSGAMGTTPPKFKMEVKPVEPEVDIEKVINDYFKDWKFDDELDIMVKPNNYSVSFSDLRDIAKRFYELGLNAKQEQPVEGLDGEIKRMVYDVVYDLDGPAIMGTSEYLSVEDIAAIARHFAEWGAEHLKR